LPSRGSNPGQEVKWLPKNDFGWFWSTIAALWYRLRGTQQKLYFHRNYHFLFTIFTIIVQSKKLWDFVRSNQPEQNPNKNHSRKIPATKKLYYNCKNGK
jgi:hypothetical protein